MKVRAKFKVQGFQKSDEGLTTVYLSAVYDPNPESENGKFWKWTPAGTIVLSTINESAAEQFKKDEEVYVDFTPVNDEQV